MSASSSAAASSSGPQPLFHYTLPPLGSLDPVQWNDRLRLECMLYHEFLRHEFQTDEEYNRKWFGVAYDIHVNSVTVNSPLPPDRHQDVNDCVARFLLQKNYRTEVKSGPSTPMTLGHLKRVLKKHGNVDIHSNNRFRETWPEWDIVVPTHPLTSEEARNPPAQSVLSNPAVLELLATWEHVYNTYIQPMMSTGPIVYTIGPTAEERLAMWSAHEEEEEHLAEHQAALLVAERSLAIGEEEDPEEARREIDEARIDIANRKEKIAKYNATRLRLAAHLLTIPGVLMDMRNDPMCPWKGMKFFHGTPTPHLQAEAVKERADMPAALDVRKNDERFVESLEDMIARLAPGEVEKRRGYEDDLRYARKSLAESKKYIADAEAKVYPCALSFSATYRGSDGRTFKGSAFLSPYLSKGFSYGGATPHIYTYKLRVEGPSLRFLDLRTDYIKSTFHDPVVDPFRHIAALSGIPHAEDPDSIKIRDEKARNLYELFKGLDVDGAVMNSDVEWIFFDAAKLLAWEPPPVENPHPLVGDQSPSLFVRTLFNHYTSGDGTPDRGWTLVHQATSLTDIVKTFVNKTTLGAFLKTHTQTTRIQLSDLPIARWSLDTTPETYISQFAVNRPTHSALWVEHQEIDEGGADGWQPMQVDVIEVDYRALWRHFAPNGELDDIWMADSIIEGSSSGVSRKTCLPYHQLCNLLRSHHERTHLLVHLPNGFVQIVPTIRSHRLDARMYRATDMAGDRPVQAMPRRTLFTSFEKSAKSMVGAFLATTANQVATVAMNALAGSKRKVGETIAAAAAAASSSSSSSSGEDPAAKAPKLMSAGTGAKLCIV